jgi:hypothetical protein
VFKNEWKGWLLIFFWPLIVGVLGCIVVVVMSWWWAR